MGKWIISCLHDDKMFCACLDGMMRDDWPSTPLEKDIQCYYDMYRFAHLIYTNGIRFTNNRAMLVTDANNIKESTEIFFKAWSDSSNCDRIEPSLETSRHFIFKEKEN